METVSVKKSWHVGFVAGVFVPAVGAILADIVVRRLGMLEPLLSYYVSAAVALSVLALFIAFRNKLYGRYALVLSDKGLEVFVGPMSPMVIPLDRLERIEMVKKPGNKLLCIYIVDAVAFADELDSKGSLTIKTSERIGEAAIQIKAQLLSGKLKKVASRLQEFIAVKRKLTASRQKTPTSLSANA